MAMTDPIADMLTRVRNAMMRKHTALPVPASKVKASILRVLEREGFIDGFEEVKPEAGHPLLNVRLKYVDGVSAITGLERTSKPGLRCYVAKEEIPWVRGGYGIAILSTSKGLMTDKEARRQGVGGEVLCSVW